jgi:hypothetical protein
VRHAQTAGSENLSLEQGVGIKKTAATLGCGIGTVIRVRNEASA